MSKLYVENISLALQKLNYATEASYTFTLGGSDYYVSNDQGVKAYK